MMGLKIKAVVIPREIIIINPQSCHQMGEEQRQRSLALGGCLVRILEMEHDKDLRLEEEPKEEDRVIAKVE